jgi:uncharacterized membrane protein YfhO
MDILLNNLISNAIWHNKNYVELTITIDDKEYFFKIQETIFERFKNGSKSEGTGLGLTLVEISANLWMEDTLHSVILTLFNRQLQTCSNIPFYFRLI